MKWPLSDLANCTSLRWLSHGFLLGSSLDLQVTCSCSLITTSIHLQQQKAALLSYQQASWWSVSKAIGKLQTLHASRRTLVLPIYDQPTPTTFVCLLPAAQVSSSVDASHALLLSSRVAKPWLLLTGERPPDVILHKAVVFVSVASIGGCSPHLAGWRH